LLKLLGTWRGAVLFTVAVVVLTFCFILAYFLLMPPGDAGQVFGFLNITSTAVAWLLGIYWVSFLIFRYVAIRVSASATAAPSAVACGSTTTITAVVTSNKAQKLLVDIEVHDTTGNKVFQHYFENEAFAANVQRQFDVAWAVPPTAVHGIHTANIGIFIPGRGTAIGVRAVASPTPGWHILNWKSGAATITVS
jgi:hypothetical protein